MSYPLPKFHFQVEWGGTKIAFTEVSGLDIETEVIEYREGNSPTYNKIKMPGLRKFSNITLKRGTFAGDNDFYNWFNTVQLNTIERRPIGGAEPGTVRPEAIENPGSSIVADARQRG